MSNVLDSVQISGNSYDLKDKNAASVSAVTQQEYDSLPSSAKTSNTFFVITDAQPADLTQYWTSAQTQSAINEATSGKVDTSSVVSAVTSASTDSEIPTAKAVYDATQSGGGSSINVVQTTGSSTTDVMSQSAVTKSLRGYVTTDSKQIITSAKTFLWSSSSDKPIIFKQGGATAKLGFSCQNSAAPSNEIGIFEFRPNTYTDSSSVSHPLLYIGHYRNTSTATAGVVQTMVGFRQYDQSGAAAYHYLMPLPAEAKTPFSLTTSFKNYFAPLGFKNGDTMITTDNTGVADFSNVLGGLKLVKITAADYANITPDDNTVYFIGDSNGYTMKLGSVNIN